MLFSGQIADVDRKRENREQIIYIQERGDIIMGIFKETEKFRGVNDYSRNIKIEEEILIMKVEGGGGHGKTFPSSS